MQSTFDRFTLAGGCFGGGVAGALVLGGTVLLDAALSPGALAWWPLALVVGVTSGFGGGVVGLRATMTPETPSRLKERPGPFVVVAALTLGLFGVAAWFWYITPDPLAGPVAGLAAATTLALGGYFGLLFTAESLYLQRIERETAVRIELPPTLRDRRIARLRKGVYVVAGVAAVAGGYLLLTGNPMWFFFLVFGLLALYQEGSEYAITDAGLRDGRSVRPWDRFESFRFEESALVLTAGGWGRSELRFPREEIDDEAAVREALSRVLEEEGE